VGQGRKCGGRRSKTLRKPKGLTLKQVREGRGKEPRKFSTKPQGGGEVQKRRSKVVDFGGGKEKPCADVGVNVRIKIGQHKKKRPGQPVRG